MSTSIPIRARDRYGAFFEDTWGHPLRWLQFVKCDFALGPSEPCSFSQGEAAVCDQDGFVLVSIEADQLGSRGTVVVSIDGHDLAGAAVHWYPENENHIRKQGFCIPVSAQSEVVIDGRSTVGSPHIDTAWMPMQDKRWRIEAAQPKEPGAMEQADTDGILIGWIEVPNGTRAELAMYAGQGGEAENDWSRPIAGASAHYYEPRDRWVQWSTATLPVGKDAWFKTTVRNIVGRPSPHLHWTPIVPA